MKMNNKVKVVHFNNVVVINEIPTHRLLTLPKTLVYYDEIEQE
jgi:hypothetical protein